jgi:hypothetical protein
MGSAGNLIIRSGGQRQMYRTRGDTLARSIFPGRTAVDAMIQRLDRTDGYHDETELEGAAVIDDDRKALTFFSDPEKLDDIPVRKQLVARMRANWAGWWVEWTMDGLEGVAAVDVGGFEVWFANKPGGVGAPIGADETREIVGIFTYTWDGRTRHFAEAMDPIDYLVGPAALVEDTMKYRTDGWEALDLHELGARFPWSGAVLDMDAKRLHAWSGRPLAHGLYKLERRWNGFEVHWLRDDFETHLRMCPELRFPERSEAELNRIVDEIVQGGGADGEL